MTKHVVSACTPSGRRIADSPHLVKQVLQRAFPLSQGCGKALTLVLEGVQLETMLPPGKNVALTTLCR